MEMADIPGMAAEFFSLLDAGGMPRQTECLHTAVGSSVPTDRTHWRYAAVWGAHATPRFGKVRGEDGCNSATPLACGLVAALRELDPSVGLVRLGYSAVEPGTHIRPHWGPTNTQLKVHLGLVVPQGAGIPPPLPPRAPLSHAHTRWANHCCR